jgi:CheY-like chemotaxis protein
MKNSLPKFNLNALVVEDNPTNGKMMKYTLKNLGIECDIAKNGLIGYEMRRKNSYDIVFMDINMPIMNGIEATQAILKYERENNLKHVPIIAVTANAIYRDREQFLADGMDEYIPKPIDLDFFINILKKFFSNEKDSNRNKNILIYKETKIDAKIIGAMVEKLGYGVNIISSVHEFQKEIDRDNYSAILLDRVKPDYIHNEITMQISSKDIPSLLFIDNQMEITPQDKRIYRYISGKITNFQDIKEKINRIGV